MPLKRQRQPKAEGERDNYKSQLETATESLEKFKDVDPAAMQGEINKLNQQLKDKDAEYAEKKRIASFPTRSKKRSRQPAVATKKQSWLCLIWML